MDQLSIALSDELEAKKDWVQLKQVIVDRGSRYTVTAGRVTNKDELKEFLKNLKSNKKIAKATHSSYAVRMRKSAQLVEVKADDGETGAGMVILRMIRKKNMINVVVVVTRWFGGVMLHGERFKHLQDGALMGIEAVE